MTTGFCCNPFRNLKRLMYRSVAISTAIAGVLVTTGSIMKPLETNRKMSLSSSAFRDGQPIPNQYTCDGKNFSPPLAWSGAPENTQSFALIVDDPDSPSGVWTHWTVFNMPPDALGLAEDFAKSPLAATVKQGKNDFKQIGYGGPCPPAGKAHRYFFKLFALDTKLNLPGGAARRDLDPAMAKHILAAGQLMGTYQRN